MMLLCALMGLVVGSFLHWAGERLPRFRSKSSLPAPEPSSQSVPAHSGGGLARFVGGRWPALSVELLTALLFAYLWGRFGPSWRLLLLALVCSFLLLIAIIDLRYRLVLNVLIYPAIVVTLGLRSLPFLGEGLTTLVGGMVGLLPFLLVALLRPGGIGPGDAKLALFIGLMLGFPQVLWALSLGILAGGMAALILLATRRYRLKSRIPYAPFLCLGAMLTLIYGPLPLILPL